MAFRLYGAKPLSEQMLEYCHKIKLIRFQNSNVFVQENAFENVVCEMAASLSRPQSVNNSVHPRSMLSGRQRWKTK